MAKTQEDLDMEAVDRLVGEDEGPWAVKPMECFVCNAEWVDVYPVGMEKSECPGCGYFVPMTREGG